jgi:serine/threonine protein kinase
MPLTDKERQAALAVVRQFSLNKEPTTHQQLLREFKDPSLIIRLSNARVFSADTSTGDPKYFPTAMTFHHSGDGELLRTAKDAVRVVVRDAQTVFMKSFDRNRRYEVPAFVAQSESANYVPVPEQIALGLFLAKDIPNTINVALDDENTSVVSFQINEHILNEHPERIWEKYIQNFDQIAQEDRLREEREKEASAERHSAAQEVQRAVERHRRPERVVNARPRTKTDQSTLRTAFNTYKLVQRSIGSGGAGTVHLVEDIDGVRYALKVLHSQAGTTRTKRFQNEIDFCSKNTHQNIVTILDHGVTDGPDGEAVPFYVMPLYPTTLRKLILKGIPPSDVLPLFSCILDGVEAAHLKGVCHRDLKPENILCDPEKHVVVVADFGIAKFQEEDLYTAVETSNHDRMANFQYSAPEQRIRGKQVTSAADIFAAGLILNEMFTGDIPQGTGYKRIVSVASDHAFLDEIVDQMIQQAPEQRPRTIAKIKEELIARGKLFISLQRLDDSKKRVIPESEIVDPLVSDPIRLVEVVDYSNSTLTLRLNRPVNDVWKGCFTKRATQFTANVSSAVVSFHGDKVQIIVSEHFLEQGVNFVKEYIPLANEEYASVVKQEHQKDIAQKRAAFKSALEQEQKRISILQKIRL